MELQNVRIDRSAPGRARLTAEVRYDDPASSSESFWFDVPERYAGDLSATGNPWLVCLAPLAATFGERLRIGLPVDRFLARNIAELLYIWSVWYPALANVGLELELSDPPSGGEAGRTGVFFSGGVDSFFTALRHRKGVRGGLSADDLILVRGFDFPLEHAEAFEKHRERMARVAEELGMELVDVATNLRETRLKNASWADLWHAAALGSVGLALERRYDLLIVASTSPYGELDPYGSHPMTDVLFSTQSTRVLHDGACESRLDKLEYLAGSSLALERLHVCYREISDLNCGRCRKCSITMLGLSLWGAGDRWRTFPAGGPDLERVGRIFFTTAGQKRGARRLRALAVRRGRRDFVRAIDRALRRSALLGPVVAALDRGARARGLSTMSSRMRRSLISRVVR